MNKLISSYTGSDMLNHPDYKTIITGNKSALIQSKKNKTFSVYLTNGYESIWTSSLIQALSTFRIHEHLNRVI